jgi:hypothetical protein
MDTKSVFPIVVALSLIGCSGKPSEAVARANLQEQIQRESSGRIRLASFQKTDGVMREFGGVKTYEMTYDAEIEFLEDCYWTGFNDGMSFQTHKMDRPERIPLGVTPRRANKGQHLRFGGHINFQKTERGWH